MTVLQRSKQIRRNQKMGKSRLYDEKKEKDRTCVWLVSRENVRRTSVCRDSDSRQIDKLKFVGHSERSYTTAASVISKPLSMMANASRSSSSVMQSGGFVKNVFQRTIV